MHRLKSVLQKWLGCNDVSTGLQCEPQVWQSHFIGELGVMIAGWLVQSRYHAAQSIARGESNPRPCDLIFYLFNIQYSGS